MFILQTVLKLAPRVVNESAGSLEGPVCPRYYELMKRER